MALVKVKYMGNKSMKKDTICNSHAIWDSPGAVVEVEDSIARKLLMHPAVWQEEGKEVAILKPEPKAPSEPPRVNGFTADEIGVMDADAIQALVEATNIEVKFRKGESNASRANKVIAKLFPTDDEEGA